MRGNIPSAPSGQEQLATWWKRDGDGWLLLASRRRLGRVVPDPDHAGLWRSRMADGSLSGAANLSWAKNAVLIEAERELAFEHRSHPAIDPSNCPANGGVFRPASVPVRSFGGVAS